MHGAEDASLRSAWQESKLSDCWF